MRDEDTTKEHTVSNPKPLPTDEFLPQEKVTDLIRELAVRPPVKGMANVKAATDVFAANQSEERSADTEKGRDGMPAPSEFDAAPVTKAKPTAS